MSKRAICSHCERPVTTCLCDAMTSLTSQYQVVILQDPKEAKHALSSAPLLAKSIVGTRLIIAECFDPVTLFGEDWQSQCLLVFPAETSLEIQQAQKNNYTYLILLDGTWRKVNRMLHVNPWLKQLACIAVEARHNSDYIIRKSPRSDGLSTIEAAASILNTLEPETDFTPILNAFHKMIRLQINAMGTTTFKKNYDV